MADKAVPDLDMAFGYYLGSPNERRQVRRTVSRLQRQRGDVEASAYRHIEKPILESALLSIRRYLAKSAARVTEGGGTPSLLG
jgi:hypothetical protein